MRCTEDVVRGGRQGLGYLDNLDEESLRSSARVEVEHRLLGLAEVVEDLAVGRQRCAWGVQEGDDLRELAVQSVLTRRHGGERGSKDEVLDRGMADNRRRSGSGGQADLTKRQMSGRVSLAV